MLFFSWFLGSKIQTEVSNSYPLVEIKRHPNAGSDIQNRQLLTLDQHSLIDTTVDGQNFKREPEPFIKGYQGSIYYGIDQHKELVIIKRLDIADSSHPKAQIRAHAELAIHRNLNHPNIIHFRAGEISPTLGLLVIEYALGGDLYEYIDAYGSLSLLLCLKVAMDISNALRYLHSRDRPIAHRDVKAENVLIDSLGNYRLADFGLAKQFANALDTSSELCGTTQYISPEVLVLNKYGVKTDVWSLAMLLHLCVERYLPFDDYTVERLGEHFRQANTQVPLLDSFKNHPLYNLVEPMLDVNPETRITAEEVYQKSKTSFHKMRASY